MPRLKETRLDKSRKLGAFHHRSMTVFPLRSRCIGGYLVVENSDGRIELTQKSVHLWTDGEGVEVETPSIHSVIIAFALRSSAWLSRAS
jgi:hypothetical protein